MTYKQHSWDALTGCVGLWPGAAASLSTAPLSAPLLTLHSHQTQRTGRTSQTACAHQPKTNSSDRNLGECCTVVNHMVDWLPLNKLLMPHMTPHIPHASHMWEGPPPHLYASMGSVQMPLKMSSTWHLTSTLLLGPCRKRNSSWGGHTTAQHDTAWHCTAQHRIEQRNATHSKAQAAERRHWYV